MTPTSGDPLLDVLLHGPLFRFADWPVEAVPKAAAGVYSIWDQARLLYVGMSGRGADEARVQQAQSVGRHGDLRRDWQAMPVFGGAETSSASMLRISWFCLSSLPKRSQRLFVANCRSMIA